MKDTCIFKMKTQESDEEPGKCGRWTRDEHQAFIDAIQLYGKNWKLVAQHIGTRSSTQVRSHAQKHFLRKSNRQAVEQQAKEFFARKASNQPKITFKVDAETQYGEGVAFVSLSDCEF
jgi:SHAQKYF class myb-like DNA-binding protein